MKAITKKFVSSLLIITMLCSYISALAFNDNDIIIELSDEPITKYNAEISSPLTQIEFDSNDMYPMVSSISEYDDLDTDSDDLYEDNPIIPVTVVNSVEIPTNDFENDQNYVSPNEIDEEDRLIKEEMKREMEQTAEESENISVPTAEINNVANNFAETTSAVPVDASHRISRINSRDSFALQNQTGRTNFIGDNIGEEYIDPMTGNLIVTETDLVLPGVDGFDLKLSRYYSLAQAELFTKTAGISTDSEFYTVPAGWYIVTESVYNTETQQTSTYDYAYSTLTAAEIRMDEIESRDTHNGLYSYGADLRESIPNEPIDFLYYYTSDITASSYQTMRNNLGAGWSWSFPSVQVVRDDYSVGTEFEIPDAMYYYDGKGNVMEVAYDESNGCSLTNYVSNDITFEILGYDDTSICNTVRIDYMVEDYDCTKYYFGPHGEVRTIIDIYGNRITFEYTYKDFYGTEDWPVISKITDTVGRKVNFRYSTDGGYDYVDVEVDVPDDERKITLSYKKKMIEFTRNDIYLSTEPVLESVEYPNGEITQYYPAIVSGERDYVQSLGFTFADKTMQSDYVFNTSGYSNTFIYLLGNIVRPHSNTYYYYDLCERNLGHSGACQAYRIDERGDDLLIVSGDYVVEGHSKNVIQYKYSYDYTGYGEYASIESIPADYYVAKTKELRENATIVRKYYKKDNAVLEYNTKSTYINPVGNDLIVGQTVEEYFNRQPVKTKLTYSNDNNYTYNSYVYRETSTDGNKSYGKPLLETKEMDYDTYLSGNYEKHGVSYTYDPDTAFLCTRSWYMSDSLKCTERFTYDSNDRLATYRMPNGTTTTYTYEYTGGKVSKKTTTIENDTGSTTIVENYTSATSYAFPSTVVKTVTAGDITTTETTSYTYDMLYGVVKTMTDNDGNTTYYEYDALGRPTRIVHPVYSTYSAYGNKNVKILPIENILYDTVALIYDGVTSTGDFLIPQRITNKVFYYDVSNVDVSNSQSINLVGLDETFVSEERNYYLGTGELIQTKVHEIVNGEDAINVTTYYYNTYDNIVEEVDAKGNSTFIQYDGAGREVKVTDQFDNYHITEYNLSSDGVGFKALSYFVPASDRTDKQNVVEYTYDRLGRTTKEKAYSDYPNASVEVRYEYDYVGNVIGIIDANNNLNEDGYTQTNIYDKLNRITSSKNANNEIIKNTYDAVGNIKKQTIKAANGAENILYQRSYDGDGKIMVDTDNAGNSNLYAYDNMGRLYASQDKDEKQNVFGYNEHGVVDVTNNVIVEHSIIARNYSHKTPHGASIVYDVRGVYDEDVDRYHPYLNEETEYDYSPTGNITEHYSKYVNATGIDGVTFQPYAHYFYDSIGNVSSVLHGTYYPDGEIVFGFTTHYDYNKNRLSKVQIDGEITKNTSENVNVLYEYYDDGKLKSVTYPKLTDNTVLKSEYVYDGLSRLTSLTNYKGTEILSSYTYTYDNNGNILTTNETVGSVQNSVTYTYDKLNRIASVSGTKGADSYYEYDVRGNRKANYEQIDFLSEENAEFVYNAEDRLSYAEVGSDTTFIDYSSNGYRYIKHENSTYPEFYMYDINGRLQGIAEAVVLNIDDGTRIPTMFPITEYVWGPDRVLAKIDNTTNTSYYYLYNGHGDVVQIVDTSGTIKNTYDYDVWGNFLKKEETIDNHFTYFGQTYDETTGLYYLRGRYYDPTTGRFTQQDSAEDGYNWYIYGNNNPIKYVDPTGESYALTWGGSTIWLAGVDGPIPAGDAIVAGVTIIGGIIDGVLYLASRNNQKGLEQGMSNNQKEKFQREIEDYKKQMGRGPGDHLPWEVLVELADYVRENYK